MNSETYSFKSILYKIGSNYAVDIPDFVSKKFKQERYIPIIGNINNIEFKGTLISKKENGYRMFINRFVRKPLHLKLDYKIEIDIYYDSEPRDIIVPFDVENAFAASNIINDFLNLSPSHQRGILGYFDEAKHAETRARRINKFIERFSEELGK